MMSNPSNPNFFVDWKPEFGGPFGQGVYPDRQKQHFIPNNENGRVVNVLDPTTQIPDYGLHPSEKQAPSHNTFSKHALVGIQDPSPLNYYFFSDWNQQRLMDTIRYQVYVRSNYKYIIAPQSKQELQIIMRAYYLQYAMNLNCYYKEQVDDLNKKVIEYCVPRILAEIQQYLGYLQDVQYMPMPIDRPININSAGTRTLRSVTTTF